MHAADAPFACENCSTALQGRYCHLCGQAAVNPLRHTGHAIEEFFESFWHLDGRVFRTLRELFVAGRVACNYLAGHRARYIAPLRLFIVLTVLTFFVGRLTFGTGETPVDMQVQLASEDLAAARTVEDVERRLRTGLAGLQDARARTGGIPGMATALDRSEAALRLEAASRVAQLRGQPAPTAAQVATTTAAEQRATPEPEFGESLHDMIGGWLRDPGRAWHEQNNPVVVSWLPAFANRAINHRVANIERNMTRLDGHGEQFLQAMLGAVPSALFLLVPVFALLLKLVYLGSGRGYLEHLVVALYSHAWLLLVLLALFVMEAIGSAVTPRSGAEAAVNLTRSALWLWIPIYLLLMQKRVYAQGWPVTVFKYLLVGSAYLFLLLGVVLYAVFATLMAG